MTLILVGIIGAIVGWIAHSMYFDYQEEIAFAEEMDAYDDLFESLQKSYPIGSLDVTPKKVKKAKKVKTAKKK